MQIDMREEADITVCRIKGDVDINSSPNVRKFFENIIKEKKKKVVVDFSEVNYVDSSGLATLVEILKKMRVYGGKLKMANLSERVLGLFEITKLDKLFDIVNGEAVKNFE
ncbi:MAG: STAS domain-containing protein [Candidatus Omnitrophica bacterium]|nr:STAS domain-containing protein [Candidatus Omnitrophota bacterium]